LKNAKSPLRSFVKEKEIKKVKLGGGLARVHFSLMVLNSGQKKSPVWRDSKFYRDTFNLKSVAPLWLAIKVKAKKVKIRLNGNRLHNSIICAQT